MERNIALKWESKIYRWIELTQLQRSHSDLHQLRPGSCSQPKSRAEKVDQIQGWNPGAAGIHREVSMIPTSADASKSTPVLTKAISLNSTAITKIPNREGKETTFIYLSRATTTVRELTWTTARDTALLQEFAT